MLDQSRSSERVISPARRRFVTFVLASAVLGAVLASAPMARAETKLLDAPRAAGIVGERYDGYAVVRGTAPPDIVALVNQVNAERRALYAERAKSENTSIEAIGKIYAVEIMKSAPPNTWFLSESGQWTQK
jgi:uncharacterized protein YdbL (DUF1318 family)